MSTPPPGTPSEPSVAAPAQPPRWVRPLRYLGPGWFGPVMGLGGLALAWLRAVPVMGDEARLLSMALGIVATAVMLLVLVGSVLRLQHFRAAFLDDLRHPMRQGFTAMLPIALLILAALGVGHLGPHPVFAVLWVLGSLLQFVVALYGLGHLWGPEVRKADNPASAVWSPLTPVLILPLVGHILVPLAGLPLGYTAWSTAQFGIGLFVWPVLVALLLVRRLVQGAWPDRLRPTAFIFLTPPAVVGLVLLDLGAPPAWGWAVWGLGAFTLAALVITQVPRILKSAFALPHWAVSFPLAAYAGLSLKLAPGMAAVAVLALASVIVFGLAVATWRGLRAGTLLAPEPVATLSVVAA